jgi:hypothetical protein
MVFKKILGTLLKILNMKKKYLGRDISWLICLMILMVSCKTMSLMNVEFPKDPKTVINDKIQSLLLINRVPAGLFTDNNPDSMEMKFLRNSYNYDTIIFDNQVIDTTLHAIGELLFESHRFDYVIPEDRFINHDSLYIIAPQMKQEDVKALCSKYKTDAILSLDYYLNTVSTSLKRKKGYRAGEETNEYLDYYEIKTRVYYSALFKIYSPYDELIITSQLFKDTLTWVQNEYNLKNILNGYIKIKEALIETGIQTALKLSDQLAPKWIQGRRKYFSGGNKAMINASRLVESNDLEEAMSIWEKLSHSTSPKSMRSKAMYNMAMGYELKGNLKEAINWGLKSYETMYRQATYNYLSMLKKLKEQQEKPEK